MNWMQPPLPPPGNYATAAHPYPGIFNNGAGGGAIFHPGGIGSVFGAGRACYAGIPVLYGFA